MSKNIEIGLVIAVFAIFDLTTNKITFAHREHKVHNIVLYPDKHSWCKTLAIKQVVSYPGCKSEEIDNNVCVGTCFSYSIPHTEPSDPGEVIVPYCDSCQPSDTTWHHVTLECTKNAIDTPPQLVKRVQIINNCSCSSCEKSFAATMRTSNQLIEDDDNDLIMSHVHDVPDVLKILNRNNETLSTMGSGGVGGADGENKSNGGGGGGGGGGDNALGIIGNDNGASSSTNTIADKVKDIKQILNHKIIILLKNIQESNSLHDKEQLMDLLRMIQGPNSNLNDKNIEDFVNSLHSENIELDIPRLREILIKFERTKLYDKHRKQQQQQQQQSHFDSNNNSSSYYDHYDGGFNENNSNNHHLHHHHHQGHHFVADDSHSSSSSSSLLPPSSSSSSSWNNASALDNDTQQMSNINENLQNNFSHYARAENHDVDDAEISQQNNKNNHYHHQNHQNNNENISIVAGDNDHDNNNNDDADPVKQYSSSSASGVQYRQHHTGNSGGGGHHHHHHHHHHIGENIISHGHLARGPHGALVIEPDNVVPVDLDSHIGHSVGHHSHDTDDGENDDDDDPDNDPHQILQQHEKLDVNPHELKPNHAGTLLSYSGHDARSKP